MNEQIKGVSVVVTCDWGFEGNQPVNIWINPRWLQRTYHTWKAHSCDNVLELSISQAYALGLSREELIKAMDKPLRKRKLEIIQTSTKR